MQDKELLSLCIDNPDKGLAYVVDQYTSLIYYIVNQKILGVGTTEDVKECVSDVFLDFYQQLNRIDLDRGSIKAYLAMIAKRKGIDWYRRLVRIAKYTSYEEEFEDLSGSISVENEMLHKEEKRILIDVIKSLGEPDSEIFIRKYYMGQKTKEIAEKLNINSNTVDKKVSRGLKKLKNMLGGMSYGKTFEIL